MKKHNQEKTVKHVIFLSPGIMAILLSFIIGFTIPLILLLHTINYILGLMAPIS